MFSNVSLTTSLETECNGRKYDNTRISPFEWAFDASIFETIVLSSQLSQNKETTCISETTIYSENSTPLTK